MKAPRLGRNRSLASTSIENLGEIMNRLRSSWNADRMLSTVIKIGDRFGLRKDGLLVKSVADRDKNYGVFALRTLCSRH